MAPRKQVSSRSTRKSATSAKSPSDANKITKKESEQTGVRRSLRLAQNTVEARYRASKNTPAIFLENGLVSMEKTPDHLVPMYASDHCSFDLLSDAIAKHILVLRRIRKTRLFFGCLEKLEIQYGSWS